MNINHGVIRLAATLLLGGAYLAAPQPAPGADKVDEISKEVLNQGLDPRQAQITAFIDYLKQNGVKISHQESGYWLVDLEAGDTAKVSIRTFPRHSSAAQMSTALTRINLPYILNPEAKMAMSYPTGGFKNPSSKKIAEELEKLFMEYRLPVIYKAIVYPSYDKATGLASLRVNEFLLSDSKKPAPQFSFLGLWKYDDECKSWKAIKSIDAESAPIQAGQARQIYSLDSDQKLMDLCKEIGLFWASWMEDEHKNGAFVFAGPILCDDVCIGPAPAGMVATCVPYPNCARAMFVPDPKLNCQ